MWAQYKKYKQESYITNSVIVSLSLHDYIPILTHPGHIPYAVWPDTLFAT